MQNGEPVIERMLEPYWLIRQQPARVYGKSSEIKEYKGSDADKRHSSGRLKINLMEPIIKASKVFAFETPRVQLKMPQIA